MIDFLNRVSNVLVGGAMFCGVSYLLYEVLKETTYGTAGVIFGGSFVITVGLSWLLLR